MVNRQKQEERFIEWVKARDDDWWEDQARISIWDFRVMQEFFNEDLLNTLTEFEREAYKRGKIESAEIIDQFAGSGMMFTTGQLRTLSTQLRKIKLKKEKCT